MKRESTIHSVAWFADQKRAEKLDLDPPYQRLAIVWSNDYKQFFIDTILKDYPSPAIFLHIETFSDGHTIYHVVDGKQRLTAIFEFINGDFTVPKKYAGAEYLKKEFDDLPDELKQKFWEYSFPVQQVHQANAEQLRGAFDRLNRNAARLTKQELRHARFPGEFLDLVQQLRNEPFWEDIGISTRTTAQRMKDIEYVSEIFLLTMHGVLEGTRGETLDGYYKTYDNQIPDKDKYFRRYRKCMRMIEDLGVERIKATRFNNLSDFYSLWVVLLRFADNPDVIDYPATIVSLEKFHKSYATFLKQDPRPEQAPRTITAYYDNARQGVNKAANRKNRADIIAELIKVKDGHSR